MVFPMRQPQPQPKEKKDSDECEIRVHRDKNGRIVGMKTRGKCTKEDRLIFAKENSINIEED